ncbi:MAG: HAMP domain-containing histidine kinase [Deltaproteobacteria bacterium]|jgi:two-component system sensor histidine kinase CpxA|nr:HAMP domain-containing histidine kinase [Deltaproteobacteria bacterium]
MVRPVINLWNQLSIFWKIFLTSMILLTSMVIIGEMADDFGRWLIQGQGHGFEEEDIIDEIVWWLLSIFVFSLAASWLFSRIITRSLIRLAGFAKRISGGDTGFRVPAPEVNRGDEIGELARGFNQMTDSLVKLLDNERRLIRDISHDLRSPLGRIRITVAILKEKLLNSLSKADQKYLSQLDKDVDRLERLLTMTLEQARLTSTTTLGVEKNAFNLASLARSSALDMSYRAKEEDKEIQVIAPEKLTAKGDEEILKRALDNLLDNALRHTQDGSTVVLKLYQREKDLVVEVKDHGQGVSEESLGDIFNPFFRTDQARRLDSGGFGLGLSIVKQAVTLHGGQVEARNVRGEDGQILGLMITLYLPEMA